MGDWDLPEAVVDPYVGIEEPDYAKFENVSVHQSIESTNTNADHSGFLDSCGPKNPVITAVVDG